MRKIIILLFFTIACVVICLPAVACGCIKERTEGLIFAEYNGGYEVKGYKGSSAEIIVPSEYNGKKVTAIGARAFANNTYVKKIIIEDGISFIGDEAFRGCSYLESIGIPDSVSFIGNSALDGCISLCFNTYKYAEYLGNDKNPYLIIIKAERKQNETYTLSTNTKIIYDYAFADCDELTEISLPDSVVSIGNHAFANCRKLKQITIPGNGAYIGHYAFAGCVLFKSIAIPSGIVRISDSAFYSYEEKPSKDYYESQIKIYEKMISDNEKTIDALKNERDALISRLSETNGKPSVTNSLVPFNEKIIDLSILNAEYENKINHMLELTEKLDDDDVFSAIDIYFDGTKEQWTSVIENSGADRCNRAYTVHCINGDITKKTAAAV